MFQSKRIISSALLAIILVGVAFVLSRSDTPRIKNTGEAKKANFAIGDIDTDSDGLKDWEERLWRTDANNKDTDNDGASDGEEVLADAAQMRRPRLEEASATRLGEAGEVAAPVRFAGLTLDKAGLDQPVDQPREPAPREEQPIRELAHPQRAVGGFGEVEENLVPAERQAVLALELGVEPSDHLPVHAEHLPPGIQLQLGEGGAGRGS